MLILFRCLDVLSGWALRQFLSTISCFMAGEKLGLKCLTWPCGICFLDASLMVELKKCKALSRQGNEETSKFLSEDSMCVVKASQFAFR